jgi:hypothetical protein
MLPFSLCALFYNNRLGFLKAAHKKSIPGNTSWEKRERKKERVRERERERERKRERDKERKREREKERKREREKERKREREKVLVNEKEISFNDIVTKRGSCLDIFHFEF